VSKQRSGSAGGVTVQISHGKIYKSYELGLAAHPGTRLGAHAQFCNQCAGWHAEPNAPTSLFPAKAWGKRAGLRRPSRAARSNT